MKKYRVAVVGVGMVGTEMVKVLKQRNFPMSSLQILATRERDEIILGETYHVAETTEKSFDNVDIALFAGTEGSRGASQTYGWLAVSKGAVVIDNGDDFRMDPRVPLVVPEVNADALKSHQGFISNPNCSTIQMVVPLAALQKAAGIKRVVVCTYQAVSGTGRSAVEELKKQAPQALAGETCVPEVYPHQIAFNVIPQVSSLKKEFPGYYGEEIKMIKEPRKILGLPDLPVSATCVRVPVLNSHSETLNVELCKELSAEEAREVFRKSPGIVVMDEPDKSVYPVPLNTTGRDEVFVGRIRKDTSVPHGIDFWCVSDNIRKGAALNAVQIAETMIQMGLI